MLRFDYNINNMKIINNKLNICFAMWLALMPMVVFLFDIVSIKFILPYQTVAWGILYFICLVIGLLRFCLKGGRLEFNKLKNPYMLIVGLILAWIMISSLINQAFNVQLIIYLSYFLMFLCIYRLDKIWVKVVLNTLLVSVAISCVMGFIDPYAKFMPGFKYAELNMSLHFNNPNYAAYVVASLAIVCFVKFNSSQGKFWNTFYLVIYLIYATHLFMNGSFVPISILFMLEIIIQVILGIKAKHLQRKMLITTIVLIPICFLVDLIPNIEKIRTCQYNYFLEGIAVFDNIFKTNILSLFGINGIAGSNGWDRQDLLITSLKALTSSSKMFIFGGGAGTFTIYTPHNGTLSLALDFGVVMPILFASLLVVLSINLIRQKFDLNNLYTIYPIISLLICYIFGSIMCNSFYVFIIMLAVLFKNIKISYFKHE